MDKPAIKIFISYAHQDEPYFKVFFDKLRVNLKSNDKIDFTTWIDKQIFIGALWDDEIQKQLAACDLAILCISDNFLVSDYIKAKEFGNLIKKFPQTILAPMLLSPCNYKGWSDLVSLQMFKPDGKKYDSFREDDFTFADLIKYNPMGQILLNPNITRYIMDFITQIEAALSQLLSKKAISPETKKRLECLKLTTLPHFEKDKFFGREEILKEIETKINLSQIPLLVSGIGGTGKTSMVLAYLEKAINNYDNVAWIDITEDIFKSIFNVFNKNPSVNFEYSQDGNREKDIESVFQLFNRLEGNNLLVIDNANNESDIETFIIECEKYKMKWKCLITTRCEPMKYKENSIKLQEVSFETGKKLFQLYNSKEFDIASFQNIYTYLNGSAFAIELLSKFSNHDTSINSTQQVWEQLKESRNSNLNNVKGVTADKNNLVELITELFDHFSLSEDEQMYLRYFSILPATPVAFDTLCILFGIREDAKTGLDEVLTNLVTKGWLFQTSNGFECHQIIQELCRKKLNPNSENCNQLIAQIKSLINTDSSKQVFPFVEIGLSIIHNLSKS